MFASPAKPIASVLLACAFSCGVAQEPTRNPKADALQREDAIRGNAVFQQNCAACHGPSATGGMGPNLIASSLVRHDNKGDAIGKVVHEGRMDKGMPAFPQLTEAQVSDIAAWLHARIDAYTRPSASGASAFGSQLGGGDAAAGKAAFAAKCAGCHSGNLDHIAAKHEPAELAARMLMPPVPKNPAATVTPAGGAAIKGTLLHKDEFTVTLRDAAGVTHTWDTSAVRVAVDDPLQAHRALLPTYTNKDVHDLLAYLETLR